MKSRLLFFLWMCLSLLLVSCSEEESVPEPPFEGGRTVLIYLAADNSLSSFALKDLEEMKEGMAKVNGTEIHLLVYIDTGSSPRLVEIRKQNGKVVEQVVKNYEDRNSVGVAETVEVFNDVFGNDKYKAESYGLIYWSHGDGWIPNPLPSTRWVGQDVSGGAYMNIVDLVSILKEAPHFDFILFDACFMQSVEVAYALRDFTDYYIGSPTEIPGPGARYDILVPVLFAEEELALNVAAAYYDPYAVIYKDGEELSNTNWTGGVSVCVLKSSELESLARTTNKVLSKVTNGDDLLSDVFNYDNRRFASYGYVGYYDMVQMMERLTNAADFAVWKQAFDKAVLYWETTPMNYSAYAGPNGWGDMFSMEGTHGVSHYIPSSSKQSAATAYRTTEWYEAAGLSQLDW